MDIIFLHSILCYNVDTINHVAEEYGNEGSAKRYGGADHGRNEGG